MAFTYRTGLGRPLTWEEMDDNLAFIEQLEQQAQLAAQGAATARDDAEGFRDEAFGFRGEAQTAKSDAQGYAQQTADDRQAVENAIADGPVLSVNGESGFVTLGAEDVGAARVDMSNVAAQNVRDAAGIGTNAEGNRTVSTGNPVGGSDGDIWMVVE